MKRLKTKEEIENFSQHFETSVDLPSNLKFLIVLTQQEFENLFHEYAPNLRIGYINKFTFYTKENLQFIIRNYGE